MKLTIVFPYYENPNMLARQVEEWLKYPRDGSVEIILVDDCSQHAASLIVPQPLPLPFRLFRMATKLRWNQHACRNLGAQMAANPWLLLLDMDNMMPPETITALLNSALDPIPRHYYGFQSYKVNGEHEPNTGYNKILIERETFLKAGQYDEDYCGIYGGDGEFLDRVEQSVSYKKLDLRMIHYRCCDIPDCKTLCFERKSETNTAAMKAIAKIKLRNNLPPAVGLTPWVEL